MTSMQWNRCLFFENPPPKNLSSWTVVKQNNRHQLYRGMLTSFMCKMLGNVINDEETRLAPVQLLVVHPCAGTPSCNRF